MRWCKAWHQIETNSEDLNTLEKPMSACQEDKSKQAKLMVVGGGGGWWRGEISLDPEDRIRFQVYFMWEAIQENNFGLEWGNGNMKGKKPLEVYYEVGTIQRWHSRCHLALQRYPTQDVRELMKDMSDSSSQSLTECSVRKLLISLCCWSEYYCFLLG